MLHIDDLVEIRDVESLVGTAVSHTANQIGRVIKVIPDQFGDNTTGYVVELPLGSKYCFYLHELEVVFSV